MANYISPKRTQVSMHFGDDIEPLLAWESFKIREKFTDALGNYSFTVRPTRKNIKKYDQLLSKGERVFIKINGHPQAKPIIVTKETSIDRKGVIFKITCKSALFPLTEGSVDPNIHRKYKQVTSIEEAVKLVASQYGFSGKIVTDVDKVLRIQAGGTRRAKHNKKAVLSTFKHKEVQAQFGESAYSYLKKLFDKHGVVLTVDTNGDLMVTQPDYDQEPDYTLVQKGGGIGYPVTGNRMLDGISISDTLDGQFSEIIVTGQAQDKKGQKRTNAPIARVRVANAEVQDGVPFKDVPTTDYPEGVYSYRSTAAPYKPLFVKNKEVKSKDKAEAMAGLYMGRQSHNAFQLTCSVPGLVSVEGPLWTVNTVVNVNIDALPPLGIAPGEGSWVINPGSFSEKMWILSREFSCSVGSGYMTNLVLIPLNSLILTTPSSVVSKI